MKLLSYLFFIRIFFSIDNHEASRRIADLFRGYPELIAGFNYFIPLSSGIDVQISVTDTNLNGVTGGTGRTSLSNQPDGHHSASSQLTFYQSNNSSHIISSPENDTKKVS